MRFGGYRDGANCSEFLDPVSHPWMCPVRRGEKFAGSAGVHDTGRNCLFREDCCLCKSPAGRQKTTRLEQPSIAGEPRDASGLHPLIKQPGKVEKLDGNGMFNS